ncbi:hypothetical protein DFW101_2766 [Solidesulfovibrio carbinoliphilus subsp. oakridgensis]|uniref:ABM domain-containing protein n=1 Tax=Solidesulfovibrio carbinoliphilus subsp. oakridgensis TaxID=694327 RepID=G7QB28_9BACT|nr:antibiotic biosynthesis monooxygenase [Solidesulfovibrio carbinoliphilus]EHJ48770.1 hypothetical protein DFW101_2766 [Solidesulfovibrio carbinoliphilus subsp. oakridgensis]
MEVRVSKVSAVVVQRVPPEKADWFLEWQRGVSAAAEAFGGFRGTDVYPPAPGQGDEWIAVIHFDGPEALDAWLGSPVRAEWVEKLKSAIGGFDLKVLSQGFGPWFVCLTPEAGAAPPPSWKMAVIVLLGLYPTVMVLALFPGPFLSPLGLAVSMLVGNALSISILQWLVMPFLNKRFSGWLLANGPGRRLASAGGLAVILGLLAGLAVLFRQVTG